MNPRTFELLEFYRLREEIAAYCVSDEGRAEFERILPAADAEEVERRKRFAGEWLAMLASETPPDFRPWQPVREFFPILKVERAALAVEQVAALGGFCKSVQALRAWAESRSLSFVRETGVCPELLRRVNAVPDLSRASAEIFAVIEPGGAFRDLPRLAAIRTKIGAIRRDIEKKTAAFFSDPDTLPMLQSSLPALKNGRQVLAVKANFRGRIRGIVHEVSQSGQTVYVEPAEIVERNNDLIAEEFRLSHEMTEILRELTSALKEFQHDFEIALDEMLFFDCISAASRWGREHKCVFAQTPSGEISLYVAQGRHPFLREKAVPIDVRVPHGIRAVIITGPNAGGKTVALKTVALFALMNQCGWPVPAGKETALPVFDFVGCDIGDDQSIEQSLSTFSSHMKNVGEMFEKVGARSLVILDELGSGTDPQEGAAIAMAVLDALAERGALLFVTTHHGAIKHYGYTHATCMNASVEFDAHTLSPTYRILMGIPGESRALEIAEKSGLPASVVSGARLYMAGGNADVSALIQGLTEKYGQLQERENRQREEESALREMRRKADLRELRLKQTELLLREKEYKRLEDFFLENRRQLENLVREIREGNVGRETTVAVKKWGEDFDRKLAAEYEEIDREKDALAEMEADARSSAADGAHTDTGYMEPGSDAIAPGTEVLIAPGGRRGTVVRRDKKDSWIVAAGTVRISVREKMLSPVRDAELKGGQSAARRAAQAQENTARVSVEVQSAESGERPVFELRLLGLRRAEAEQALIHQLDLAVMSGLHEFSVIHGKGNGVLQDAVIAVLKNYPAVADFHFALPEHGGTGKTIVRMT